MTIKRIIKTSLRQLQINLNRSLFAVAALSVGIAAVIAMAAIGNGARIEAINQLQELGTNLITVNAGKVKNVVQRKDGSDRVTTLRMRDCEKILSHCPTVKEAVPSLSGTAKVKSGNATTQAMVNGVTSPYFKIRNFEIQFGKIFTEDDDRYSKRVAVIGSQVSQNLFGSENPVGKIIMVGKVPFTILGTLKSKGLNAEGANLDAQVIIPVKTAMRRIYNVDYLNRIFVEVEKPALMNKAEKEIQYVLRDYHHLNSREKENDFTIDNQLTAIETSKSSSRSFTWLIVGVSGLALLIGGIGILAVMMLSVRIRSEEIGLRISVGAKRKDITLQFLAESSLLGLTGGLSGIFTGLIIAFILSVFSSWQIAVSATSVIVSFVISAATGLVFGVIPARKAAQSDPIVALQKD
jgi:putative ABC transport system permease protein